MRDKNSFLPALGESKKETEKRLKILDDIIPKLKPFVESLILVGSMAYGRNYSVRKESDVDLVILINKESVDDIFKSGLFEMNSCIEEAIFLFKRDIVQHFTIIRKINDIEMQFHFWDKQANFKAERLEKPWSKWYCPIRRDKHYFKGNNLLGEEIKKEIKNIKRYKYGDVFIIPPYLINKSKFVSLVIISNLVSSPEILYTKDDSLYKNINLLWKKIAENFIKENINPNDLQDALGFIYGNWNFSPESRLKIKKRLMNEII
ncbi:MAG: nucleotidyltransferase domain-containing protein [Nanoarchaeota archaeon]|nr:nucleotidyltransferase domain-containing protein [Nanoarchaeota archaeon]